MKGVLDAQLNAWVGGLSAACPTQSRPKKNTLGFEPLVAAVAGGLTRTVRLRLDKTARSNIPHGAAGTRSLLSSYSLASLAACRHAIASLELDVLVFTEIGRSCDVVTEALCGNDTIQGGYYLDWGGGERTLLSWVTGYRVAQTDEKRSRAESTLMFVSTWKSHPNSPGYIARTFCEWGIL